MNRIYARLLQLLRDHVIPITSSRRFSATTIIRNENDEAIRYTRRHMIELQLPADDYQCAMQHLMGDSKFLCHVCCYNVPAAVVIFTLLLVLCLIVVPLLERKQLLEVHVTAARGTRHSCSRYTSQLHMLKVQITTYELLNAANALLKVHVARHELTQRTGY